MFCHVCGAKLIENACFCSKCGTPVPPEVWAGSEEAPAAPREPYPTPSPAAPEPVPVPEMKPESVPEVKSEPVQKPAPAPEPTPKPELPEEKVVAYLWVTKEQIQKRETVVLQNEALQAPMQLTLRQSMRDGMRLRLTNATLKPSPTGAKRSLVVVLRVKIPVQEAAEKSDTKPEPKATPAPKRKTVSFVPVMAKCGFQLCPERELKTGYHFGGNEDEGHLYISPEQLTLYKKSKAVGIAFGAIGSAIEGKGKQLAVLVPEDVASHEKASKNDYRIHLKDGRILKVCFFPRNLEASLSALEQFLSQI